MGMVMARAHRWSRCLALAGLASCAATPPPKPAAPPAPAATADPGMRVEKVREELQMAPWDLAFSAVRGAGAVTETVTARNLTDGPVTVRALPLLGEDAAQFQLNDPPKLPALVPPKGQLSVGVTFAPPASAALGVHRALLRFQTGPTTEDGPGTDLSGLATLGRAGESEPSLAEVVEVLGYAVDVGRRPAPPPAGTGAGSAPAADAAASQRAPGDEVRVPLFVRATPTPVALNPVARFSTDGPRPYGSYKLKNAAPALETLATLATGQHQTLNPELEPDGNASFDAGDAVFGVWVKSGKRTLYSEDQRNTAAEKHAARVFPLRARGGAPVPNAYLIAFRDGADDAYQDYVFVLWNVKPAPVGPVTAPVTAPAPRSP
jgi:hypothetical protein